MQGAYRVSHSPLLFPPVSLSPRLLGSRRRPEAGHERRVRGVMVVRRGVVVVIGRGALSAWLLAWPLASAWSISTHSGEGGRGVGLACSRGGGKVVGDGKRTANAHSHCASARVSEAAVSCCSTTPWPFLL